MKFRFCFRSFPRILPGLMVCVLAGCPPQDQSKRSSVSGPGASSSAPAAGPRIPAAGQPSESPRLGGEPPEGWTPAPAGGMRKLAFEVQDGERHAEITAIDLAASAGGLLPNVNRWRKQIALGEMTQEELDKAVTPIPVAGAEGKYIELVGPPEASPRQAILGVVAIRGDRAWFFKLLGDTELVLREKERFQAFVKSIQFAASSEAAPMAAGPSEGDSRLVWDAPNGWTADESGDRRRTAYHVTEGDRQIEITVLELPGTVEKLLPNVNLWRRQVHLGEVTQEQLAQSVSPCQVAGMAGHYIELLGPEDAQPRLAVLRVLVSQAGKTWLISMTGEADLVLREKERFQAFLNSARLASAGTEGEAEPPREP